MQKYKKIIFIVVIIIASLGYLNNQIPKETVNIENLKNAQLVPWGIKKSNAYSLWPEVTGKGVKVAIMDSGINFKHPDFGNNIKIGYNAIHPNELPVDDFGHGTLVTGVIAAQNNNFGVVGVAPDVELYPVKVLDECGKGEISTIVDGIDWCIKNKIQIINMSFAIKKDNQILRSSINKALDAGIIIVASASNSFNGKVGYPASYEGVISVTSIDVSYKLGVDHPRGKIDFSAPGVDIISTYKESEYMKISGDSLAAPHITGLIALVLQNPIKFGRVTNQINLQSFVFDVLRSNSKDLGKRGKDNIYGYGYVYLNEIK